MIGECFVLVSGHQLGNSEFSGPRNFVHYSVNGIMHGCCRNPDHDESQKAERGCGLPGGVRDSGVFAHQGLLFDNRLRGTVKVALRPRPGPKGHHAAQQSSGQIGGTKMNATVPA